MDVVGYTRVSTSEQGQSGAGLRAQRDAIESESLRRGWTLLRVYSDTASGRSVRGRLGLEQALETLDGQRASALVVAKLDRLSRSLVDFASMLEHASRKGWALVALDLGVDTTTPSGELVANVMASVAQWERKAIGQRTKDALAVKRQSGVRLGRPPALSEEVRSYIASLRVQGLSLPVIARRLNCEEVPTAHGGRMWYPDTVRKVLLVCGRT